MSIVEFKRWNRKFPNPLDLDTIVEDKYFIHTSEKYGKFYVRMQAMRERTRRFGTIAFIGITIRQYQNNDFVLPSYDVEEIIKNEIKSEIEAMEKRTGIKNYI